MPQHDLTLQELLLTTAAPQEPCAVNSLAYRIRELAKASGISRSKIYEAIAGGELRAVKNGRSTLVLPADARAWLDNLPHYTPSAQNGSSSLPIAQSQELISALTKAATLADTAEALRALSAVAPDLTVGQILASLMDGQKTPAKTQTPTPRKQASRGGKA